MNKEFISGSKRAILVETPSGFTIEYYIDDRLYCKEMVQNAHAAKWYIDNFLYHESLQETSARLLNE